MNDVIRPAGEEPSRFSASKLIFGIALVAVGVLAFLDAIDVWEVQHVVRHWWPLILLAIGVSQEVDTLRTRRGDGGYILIALGVWFLAATNRFLGLNYATAFPLGVTVAGLGIVVHALLGVDNKKKKEKQS